MKALVQRVSRGSVSIDGTCHAEITGGFVVLLGVRQGDTEEDAKYLAQKTVNLRVFPDQDDRMNLSIQDTGGDLLVISQFTLYADTKKGNRPSFVRAALPDVAAELYGRYVELLRDLLGTDRVATGVFGAMMSVEIINDGPVTVELNSDDRT